MAVGDLLGDLGVDLPTGSLGGNFLQNFGIVVVGLILFGIIFYWWYNKRSYNKTIIKIREISGIPAFAGEAKAREVVLPFTSTRALQVKGSGIFLPRPSIETGKDRYLYFIRDDGEWLNIGFENINETLRQLGLKFDHTDMRMANASLKKLVEKNYKKLNWLKEYAPYIGFGILILMLAIAGYLILGEAGKVAASLNNNVEAMSGVAEALEKILNGMEGIAPSSGVAYAT